MMIKFLEVWIISLFEKYLFVAVGNEGKLFNIGVECRH